MRGGPVGRSAVVTVARRRPALATRLACVHAVANRMRGIQGLSHSLGSSSSLPQDSNSESFATGSGRLKHIL